MDDYPEDDENKDEDDSYNDPYGEPGEYDSKPWIENSERGPGYDAEPWDANDGEDKPWEESNQHGGFAPQMPFLGKYPKVFRTGEYPEKFYTLKDAELARKYIAARDCLLAWRLRAQNGRQNEPGQFGARMVEIENIIGRGNTTLMAVSNYINKLGKAPFKVMTQIATLRMYLIGSSETYTHKQEKHGLDRLIERAEERDKFTEASEDFFKEITKNINEE